MENYKYNPSEEDEKRRKEAEAIENVGWFLVAVIVLAWIVVGYLN